MTRHAPTYLWLLFLFALGLRGGFCAIKGTEYPVEYRVAAQRLLTTGTLTSPLNENKDDTSPSSLMPPVYVALVAAVFLVFGPDTPIAQFALLGINAAATALVVPLVFSIVRTLFGERAAWRAAVLAAIHPVLIRYTNFIWDTNLFTFAATFVVWYACRLRVPHVRAQSWLLLGALLGAVALLNPALTVTYPMLVLWPATFAAGWRARPVIRAVVLTVLGWAIVLTPWTVRNYAHFDRLIYVRGGFDLELWLGAAPEVDDRSGSVYPVRFPLANADEQRRFQELGETAYLSACGRDAREAIARDPARYAKLVLIRWVDFWTGDLASRLAQIVPLTRGGRMNRIGVGFVTLELLVLIVAGLWVRRINADQRWMLAMVLVFPIVYALTHGGLRFRAPIEPVIVMLTISILSDALGQLESDRPTRASP